MLEILEFVFGSVWHFLGTVILLYVLGEVIVSFGQAIAEARRP